MKNTLTLIVLALFFLHKNDAQVVLEKIYTPAESFTTKVIAFESDKTKKTMYAELTKERINIYDSSHELYKEVIAKNDSYFKQMFLPTDHLFNDDDNIELIVLEGTNENSYGQFCIINENGEILQRIGPDRFYSGDKDESMPLVELIEEWNGGRKIKINGSQEIYIYDVTGVSTPNSITKEKSSSFSFYPNPTYEVLTIEFDKNMTGTLNIYDLNGKHVKSNDVDQQRNIEVEISTLRPGTYLWQLNNIQSKFVKE